jgi:putative oxidoreductase
LVLNNRTEFSIFTVSFVEPKETIMDILTRVVARYCFALPFFVFGVMHFMAAGDMAGMVPGWIPGGVFWVILTGIALVAASISMIIKVYDRLATFLLGIMLLIFVLTMHLPAAIGGDQMGMTNLLKDFALAGAAWLYAGYVANYQASSVH